MGSNPVEATQIFFFSELLKLRLQLRWSCLHFICISAVYIIFIQSINNNINNNNNNINNNNSNNNNNNNNNRTNYLVRSWVAIFQAFRFNSFKFAFNNAPLRLLCVLIKKKV